VSRERAKRYNSTPSREEQFDFLVRCYFGEGSDLLRLCIHRAYLDFNRTLHGFANHKTADHLRQSGYDCVLRLLTSLRQKKIRSSDEFDKWHEAACVRSELSGRRYPCRNHLMDAISVHRT